MPCVSGVRVDFSDLAYCFQISSEGVENYSSLLYGSIGSIAVIYKLYFKLWDSL